VGRTSSLAIVLLVFVTLFLLLFTSSYFQTSAKHQNIEALKVKKTDVIIQRIDNASAVCFVLEASDLAQHGFLSYFVEEADLTALYDEPDEDGSFDAFGGGANTVEVVQFIEDYESEFSYTSEVVTLRGKYTDRIHIYKCDFEHGGKHYGIWFELRSLTEVSDYAGYVPMLLNENGITAILRPSIPQGSEEDIPGSRYVNNPTDLTVYVSFNDTVLWTNAIDNPTFDNSDAEVNLTLTRVDAGDEPIEVSARIPAGQSWDYRLRPNYSANETMYHYAVSLQSEIKHEGNIHVAYYPRCMSQAEARSFYGQNGIDMRYPSYLPDDYRYVCGTHMTGFSLIQSYWNGSEADMQRVVNETGHDSFEAYATRQIGLQNGVVQIWSFKAERTDDPLWNVTAKDKLRDLTTLGQRNVPGAQIIEIDPHNGVFAYAHAWQAPYENINVLEISDPSNGEEYIIRARLPMAELVRIAQSMFR
jgi:hypothetical protein